MVQVGLPLSDMIPEPQVLAANGGAGTQMALQTVGYKVGMIQDTPGIETAAQPPAPASLYKGPVPTV